MRSAELSLDGVLALPPHASSILLLYFPSGPPALHLPPSPPLAADSGTESIELGSEVYIDAGDAEEDSDFDVESVRGRGRGRGGRGGLRRSRGRGFGRMGRPPGSGRPPGRPQGRPRSASVIGEDGAEQPRRRGRPPGSGKRRGGRARRGDLGRRGGVAKPPRGAPRADDEEVRAAGAVVVGARVSVFWSEDDAFYRVSAFAGRAGLPPRDGLAGWPRTCTEHMRPCPCPRPPHLHP